MRERIPLPLCVDANEWSRYTASTQALHRLTRRNIAPLPLSLVVIEISARVYAEYRQNEPGIPPQTNVLNNTFYYLTLQNDVNPISLIRLEVFFCEPLGR